MKVLINIDVADLAKAERFYTEAFGLKVGRRFEGGSVELLGADTPLYLLENAAGTQPAPTPAAPRDYRRHWKPVHLDFAVEDLEAAVARAHAAGATLEQDVATHAWGRIATFADPFGNGFCLLQFSAAGYDAIAL